MALYRPVKIIKRGNKYQFYFYNPRGERRRVSVGEDFQYAQRLAVKFNDCLLEGKDPEIETAIIQKSSQRSSVTLKEIFPDFMHRHGIYRSKGMQRSYDISFRNFCRCPDISEIPLRSIAKYTVLEYMHARREQDGVTASTVNKDAAFLKCLLSRAVEWGIIENNPLQGMRLMQNNNRRDVYLDQESAKALVKQLPEPLASIVEFAIYTGFRKENILSLEIEVIRFHNITGTGEVELLIKGGRRELFPLSRLAVKVLHRVVGSRKSGYVFINPKTGTRYSSIHKSFNQAVKQLGLTIGDGSKLRFHDLRHVFATWLHREGVSLDNLRSLLGHRDRATTDRYTAVDRISTGRVLSLIPDLRDEKNIEAAV